MPKHILKDRSGNLADVYDISEPMLAEAKDGSRFVCEEDGNEILITNHIELSSAIEASIEVSYSTSKSTFEYLDMGESNAFSAEMNITASGNSATAQTEEISVYINTSAKLKSTQKQNATQHYRNWDSSWGDAPENASSYYYIVWPIISYIDESTTQPYNFVLEDTFNETDAEIVGYKMQGESTFTNKNYSNDLKTKGYRYDYVLTRHLISTYENQEAYRLDNSVKATLTPADGLDSSDSISSSGYYNYSKPVYNPPGGRFISRKYGNSNWYDYFRRYWDIADYSLNDLQNGTKTCIDENLKYFEYIDGYAYRWTLADGASESDVEAYGQKKVKYELTDGTLYFESGINEENPRPLTYEDYEVKKIDYSWNIKDAEFNNDTKKFQAKAPTYTAEDDALHFYAKFGNSDEWEEVGTYDLFTETAESESNCVVFIDDSQISFVEGSNCTAWKIVTENVYYYTRISAYPYYRLKNSSYIMQNIEGKNRVALKNTSNAKVTQEDGTPVFSADNWAVDYIVGIDPHSDLQKKVTNVANNKSERYVSVGWQLDMKETYTTNAGVEYVKQDSGTFYDLLPAGASADETTVRIRTEDGVLADNFYEIDTQSNYKGTGRNLLKVTVDKQAKYYILTFTATYLWDNLKDYGKNLQNIAAYETGNDIISQGYPDNGGTLSDSSIMNDLDPQTSDEKFIYTQNEYEIDILTSSFLGLTKMVKTPKDTKYSDSINANINSEYIYRLRYSKDAGKAKNMILFDSLENYVTEDNKESDWHGILESVDISQPEKLGIAPTVYYSTIENLNISAHHDLSERINGEKVWQTESEIGNVSLAKAIAVDMSKDSDSDSFIFDGECSVAVPIYMKSPESDNTGKSDPKAYNNVFISYTSVDELSNEEDEFFHYNYTTAHLRVAADIGIYKADSTDIEKPVEDITFRLTGTSGYGTSVDISKKTGKNGKIKFSNIEKGTYTLFEDKGTDDYLRLENQMEVIIDGNGRVTIDGTEVAKGSYFTVLDEPRVHTDIQFYKKDSVRKNLGVNNAKFKLWGASEYKNEVIMYATSDASGKVEFENIELGSYKLQEVEAPDGYIRNRNIYSVVVDENAVFSISGTDSEYTTSGNYEIYNEPYHKFTIQKEGYTAGLPIHGAVFTLNGISKYGTSVDYEDDTDSTGKLTFSNLEPGNYILQETSTPEGYDLDATKRIVTIDKYGNITISGVETNSTGHFVIKNKEAGTVTITKKWIDNSDNDHRPTPTITVSSQLPSLSATFKGANGYSSMLTRVTSASNIKSFSKAEESEYISWAAQTPEEDRIHLETDDSEYPIYAWYNSSDGSVKWWSNAKTVYFPENSSRLFIDLYSSQSIDLSGIDTSNVTDMSFMFSYLSIDSEFNVNTLNFGDNFDTSNVTNMSYMFDHSNLTNLDISSFNTYNVTDMSHMFEHSILTNLDINSLNTSNVTDMSYMFAETYFPCLASLDFSNFVTSKVTDMSYMFAYSSSPEYVSLDLSNLDLSNVTDMGSMFESISSLYKVKFSDLPYNSKVKNIGAMFMGCDNLTEVKFGNNFAVNCIDYMFYECESLTKLDISRLNTSNVTYIDKMFYGCSSLTELDLSSFNTYNVTYIDSMFSGCSSLTELDLSSFNTYNVTYIDSMFYGCSSLIKIYVHNDFWYVDPDISSSTDMFYGCRSLVGGQGTVYNSRNTDIAYAHIDGGRSNPGYLTDIADKPVSNALPAPTGAQAPLALTSINVNPGELVQPSSNTASTNLTYDIEDAAAELFKLNGADRLKNVPVATSTGNTDLTYVSTDTDHCTIEQVDADTWTYTFSGLDANLQYYAWEDNLTGYTSSNPSDNPLTIVDGKGTIINTTEAGTITITKKWVDYSDNAHRPTPTITLSSNPPELSATFLEKNGSYSMLTRVTSASNIQSFSKCDEGEYEAWLEANGEYEAWLNHPENKPECVVQMDDGTTDYRIYAWYDNTDNLGKVKWWSNANKVYFPISSNSLFSNLTNVKKIILSGIDSSKTTNMSYMFGVCRNLTTLNLGDSFDTSNVGNIHQMFYACSSLRTLDLGNKFDTSKVTDMKSVFYNCSSLTNLNIGSNFNTSRVNNMASMFQSCGLTTLNLGDKFYTSNVTSMQRMFAYSKLTTLDLSSFNTSKVTNMSEMFKGCSSLTRIYASDLWNTNAVTSSTDMFSGCSKLVGGEGTSFNSGNINATYARIDKKDTEGVPGYLTYKAAPVNSGSTTEPTTPDSTTTPEITYVSTDSEHCIIKVIDENTWNYTFLAPDPDVQYYAWEDDLSGYTSSNPIEDHLTLVDGKGTITNTTTQSPPEFGSLSISKEVVSSFPGDTDPNTAQLTSGDLNRTFLFTVTLTDEDDNPLQGNEIYGDSVFTNGETSVRLAHGDSVTISDIPAGYHYTVKEAETGGFQAQQSTLSDTIVAETQAQADFVNKKLIVETTSLTLKKEVTGNFEDNTESFRFDVSLENLLAGEIYTLSNGETYIADDTNSANKTVYLQDDEQISFRDIPVGASYKITEEAGDYISSYEITDANSLNSIRTTKSANTVENKPLSTSLESVDKAEVSGVEKIEDVTVTFTNEKHKTADLAVKVLVTNAEENNTDSFALELVMKGLEPSMSYETDFGPIKSDSDGEITTKINLSSDDEVVLYDLPVKSTYKIKELANEYKASYELVDANDLGKIETETASNTTTLTDLSTDEETVNEGEEVTVIFTNERIQKNLTVTKVVDITYGNEDQVDYENQEFEFDIEFTGLGANIEYILEYSQDGVVETDTETFTSNATQTYTLSTTLKHGQSVTIKDLPTNATYRITEKAVKFYIAAYTATGNANANITDSYMTNLRTNTALSTSVETVGPNDADVHFIFTNTYAASDYILPETGLRDIKVLLMFIMFGTILFAAIYFVYNKRDKKLTKSSVITKTKNKKM